MIRVLVILATLLSWSAAHAADQALSPLSVVAGRIGEPRNIRSLGVGCSYSQNDTATLRAAIESGVCAGTTCKVPAGCKILVGSPGSGDSVAEFPSNTTIECEDGTAGFVLARKSCSSGSDTPGAACTADNQCKNGTCDPDYPTGDSFAPNAANTYSLFTAATGSSNVTIRGCSIWANGISKNYSYRGGNDKVWGYCDGTGPTDVLGQGCAVTCDAASGVLFGLACTSGGCGAGTCVENAGDCKTNGGACVQVPYTTNWAPAGAGKINLIDFSNATNAHIESVNVYDHRRGDFSFKTGAYGTIRDSSTDLQTPSAAPVATYPNYVLNASVSVGIVAGTGTAAHSGTYVENTYSSGWDAGIEALGWNTLINVTGSGFGGPTESTWKGSTGLLISSAGVEAYGFRGGANVLNCIRPKFGLNSGGGYNFLVSQPYCDSQIGPKFIVQGAGNIYSSVRGAWQGRGSIVGLGDQRGRCSAGTRSGKVCVFGSGSDSVIGCPGSSCAVHDDFPAEGATHFFISGGSLLHTSRFCQGGSNDGAACSVDATCTLAGGVCAGISYVRTTDGKRCNAGSRPGLGCTTDSDCTGGGTGSCQVLGYSSGVIEDVDFFNGSGNTAIDVSTSSVGVDTRAGFGSSISGWRVSGLFGGFATGFKFPTLCSGAACRWCQGGSNSGATCTADATCTGGGLCRAAVESFVASGSMAAVTTPLQDWDASYGDVSGLAGLLPTDDQGKPISLLAGEALTRGQLVSVSTSADNTVVKTSTANPERAAGVVMADALNGAIAKVLTQGVGPCIADGTISNGDTLKPSGSTAGRVVATTASSDLMIARALDAATSGATFDCLIGTPPTIQNTTASFPKFAEAHSTGTTSVAACASATALATITQSATSGRSIRLQGYVPLDITASVTRVFTTFITRGGSSCTAGSPVTLVTADSEITSQQNITAAIAATDTGQSGSVTYRLCFCADTGSSGQAGSGAALLLTEY